MTPMANPFCHAYVSPQGGLTLGQVLHVSVQVLTGLQHLHRLGVLHRDLRTSNILMEGRDPLHVLVADFGVSHVLRQLEGAAGTVGYEGLRLLSAGEAVHGLGALGKWICSPLKMPALILALMRCCCAVLFASGPMSWSAPEVLASMSTGGSGVVATAATDMYQFGGTLHEIMTCGDAPFWWLLKNMQLLCERRCSGDLVEVPGTEFTVAGLLGKSTLQAAVIDRKPITWRVRVEEGSEGSAHRLRELVEILEGCLEEEPGKRWKGNALYVGMVGWALGVFRWPVNAIVLCMLNCTGWKSCETCLPMRWTIIHYSSTAQVRHRMAD